MLKLASPAKINLFLQVVSRRSDGYHELASLFQTVDLHDTLFLSLANKDSLECSNPSLPAGPSNLLLKAADLFRRKTGLKFGLQAYLQKRIPFEAGLGGGSSNAATALWGINQLLGRPAEHDQLLEWAAEIGSDVSFFLSSGTAYCTGRGEIVHSLPPLPPANLWLIKPGEGLSTPLVYKKLESEKLPKRDPKLILEGFLKGQPTYFNDLEKPAFELLPSLAALKHSLASAGFSAVLMSGSGTTFFCIGDAQPPSIPGAFRQKVSYINRSSENWY